VRNSATYSSTLGAGRHARRVAELLRAGRCPPDFVFDRFLPGRLRAVAPFFWTPLSVAARAAEWFEECGVQSVVDIGSGVGKFCIATALMGRGRFIGLEHRGRCVLAARELARLFEVSDRVCFLEGAFGVRHTPEVDAYYLYNPFAENLFGARERLDNEVALDLERFRSDVEAALQLFETAPVGTHVLTYNGFGAEMPEGYVQIRNDLELPNALRLWRKVPREQRGRAS
jgi:hypothetical protein